MNLLSSPTSISSAVAAALKSKRVIKIHGTHRRKPKKRTRPAAVHLPLVHGRQRGHRQAARGGTETWRWWRRRGHGGVEFFLVEVVEGPVPVVVLAEPPGEVFSLCLGWELRFGLHWSAAKTGDLEDTSTA
ncbi:uncharacterized protein A4U43_C05F9260 [Asparagus officinalis]|uniref:Uncharacterized protein n=1 Tax=Asparagus officinalis TaxID=4686 RepID=A0A5P1ET09_ASPOF|nr:uncharacterized protein A4U43_C05F9260 [Asparagus officinalis]